MNELIAAIVEYGDRRQQNTGYDRYDREAALSKLAEIRRMIDKIQPEGLEELRAVAIGLSDGGADEKEQRAYSVAIKEALGTLRPDVKDYLDSGGVHCPFCKSDDIIAGHFEIEAKWQPVECGNCGRAWHDTYRLTGIDWHGETYP